jgi:hypothetical protein
LTHYWLLGINDTHGKLQLRVIELRSQSYPDLVPWPLLSVISPRLLFYQTDAEQTQLEVDLDAFVIVSAIVRLGSVLERTFQAEVLLFVEWRPQRRRQ